jgi:hypothetical protein
MNGVLRRGLVTGAGLAFSMVLGAVAWSQNEPAAQQSQPSAQQQNQPAAQDASQAQHTIQMVQAQAQLDKTLDTKKAKQGDPVTAKLQQNVQIPDSQALPKNTVLEGHVDQVQGSENKGDSTVTVTFDKAKLKDGKELPIKATVLAVSEPVYAQQQAAGGAPGGAPAAMPSGGAPSGGGSMGNGSATPAPAPEPMNVPDASQGPSRTTQSHGGVPDVMLKSDIHEPTSVTFSSKGKNVHVPDGTQMQFALAVIPAGVTVQ